MNNVVEYNEVMAFHPGYYIVEIVEDMGVSQAEFATRMGTTPKTLSKLINGQTSLSNDLAKKLSTMLGTSVDVWLNLQKTYDEKLIEIETQKEFDSQVEIARLIDYSYFEAVAFLPRTKRIREKIANLCKYFAVSNLNILLQPDFLVNYRTGIPSFETKNVINSKAWIQTAINYSKTIKTASFNANKLKSFLPEIRTMTVQAPEIFLPRMKDIFSECGVAFVLLPHLKNSGVNGAVKWVSPDRVVLAMNNRGLYADKFWFSLFHEIKHVLQQKITKVFISGSQVDLEEINDVLEEEADSFAQNLLIPTAELRKLNPTKFISDDEVIAFAKKMGIHPGIVVGRLQHEGIIGPNRCAKLREKYEITLESAD